MGHGLHPGIFPELNGCDGAARRAETSVAKASGDALPILVDR